MYNETYVQAGIAYLDREHPNWREVVRPEVLRIDDPRTCVLGQLEHAATLGDYVDYLARHKEVNLPWAIKHGFVSEYELDAHMPEEEQARVARREALLLSARWITELVCAKMPTPST